MISLEVTNIDKVLEDFKRFGKRSDEAVKKASDDTAKAVITDSRMRLQAGLSSGGNGNSKKSSAGTNVRLSNSTHTRTNTLSKSIERKPGYEKDQNERVIGTNIPYAPYVEFGTGDFVFTNSEFDDQAKEEASKFKGKKKVRGMIGVSFLNWAAVNQRGKFIERLKIELNKLL